MNEDENREKVIDPMLRVAWWSIVSYDKSRAEESIEVMEGIR